MLTSRHVRTILRSFMRRQESFPDGSDSAFQDKKGFLPPAAINTNLKLKRVYKN
jgi:hypothetical protein